MSPRIPSKDSSITNIKANNLHGGCYYHFYADATMSVRPYHEQSAIEERTSLGRCSFLAIGFFLANCSTQAM